MHKGFSAVISFCKDDIVQVGMAVQKTNKVSFSGRNFKKRRPDCVDAV